MFGFQRIADLIWAAADSRARGFLIGAIAGKTSLPGEGLQHCDGNSQIIASLIPNCMSYDLAFNYEIAIIIQYGLKKMFEKQEDIFFYINVYNKIQINPDYNEKKNIKNVKLTVRRRKDDVEQKEENNLILKSKLILNASF